jgi:hypothetical protein
MHTSMKPMLAASARKPRNTMIVRTVPSDTSVTRPKKIASGSTQGCAWKNSIGRSVLE